MTTIKRFSSALFGTLFLLALAAQAQTPSVSTVNVTPETNRVRVAAVGDVLDMRVAVSDESGDVVFESGPVTGDKLDWAMNGPQGQRVPAGTYTLTVTYRTSNGKLKRRVEQVSVTEEVLGGTQTAAGPVSSSPTPTAVGAITGEGTANRLAKFTAANTIGNSAVTEAGGRVGIGTASPAQSIHAVGASSRLRLQSTGGTALTTTEYVTNGRVWQAGAGGSTAANGVANKFFVFDQTASQFRFVVDPAGSVGIGTSAPAFRLHVVDPLNAGLRVQTNAAGGNLASFGGNGNFRIDAVNIPGGRFSVQENGNIGMGTDSPAARLDVRGDIRLGPSGQYRATSGEENLRIIRGTIAADGTIISGTGFQAGRVSGIGRYFITPTTPFAAPPTVVITGEALNTFVVFVGQTDGVTASRINVLMQRLFDGDNIPFDAPFHFIAIGPR